MPKFKTKPLTNTSMLEYLKDVLGCGADAKADDVAKAITSNENRNKVARFVGNEPLRKGWYLLTYKCGHKTIKGNKFAYYELQPIVSKDDRKPNGQPIDISAMSLLGQRNIDNVKLSGTYDDQYYDEDAKQQKNEPFNCTADDFVKKDYVDVCKDLQISEDLYAFATALEAAQEEKYTVLVEYHGEGCKVSTAKQDRKHINGGTVRKGYQSVFRVRIFTLHFIAPQSNTGAK